MGPNGVFRDAVARAGAMGPPYGFSMTDTPPTTEYERYLRIPELLSLQKPAEDRAVPEELHFQAVHQSEELLMKMALGDMDSTIGYLLAGNALRAAHCLRRATFLVDLMSRQLGVLEFLSPHEYYAIRARLGRGSGQESPGFNRMMAMFPKVWVGFEALLNTRGVDLRTVYDQRAQHEELYALCEAMIDLDEGFQSFRGRHILLVKRIIGTGTPSLKGKPTELLERSQRTQFFEPLWRVREAIFDTFTPGAPLGADGCPVHRADDGHGSY